MTWIYCSLVANVTKRAKSLVPSTFTNIDHIFCTCKSVAKELTLIRTPQARWDEGISYMHTKLKPLFENLKLKHAISLYSTGTWILSWCASRCPKNILVGENMRKLYLSDEPIQKILENFTICISLFLWGFRILNFYLLIWAGTRARPEPQSSSLKHIPDPNKFIYCPSSLKQVYILSLYIV